MTAVPTDAAALSSSWRPAEPAVPAEALRPFAEVLRRLAAAVREKIRRTRVRGRNIAGAGTGLGLDWF